MKLSEIAQKIGCRMENARNSSTDSGDVEILRIAGIEEAGPGDLTFVSNRKYIRHIKNTKADAIILDEDLPAVEIPSLRTRDPYLAFAHALEIFHVPFRQEPGIHASAVIDEDAELGSNPSIGANVIIGKGCRLGADVTVFPNSVLYPGVQIDDGTVIHSCVTVREYCRLGKRVILQNGVVVGGDGLGFVPVKDGSFYKILQTGRVIIEDDVEVGANTTIDRAAVGDTVIRKGAKLDNLVQVGHGSQVGENSILAAQVGLAGSTRLGRGVWVGGQAGFAGHQDVGDKAIITAQSGTSHDIPSKAVVSGSPGFDNGSWLRSAALFPKLPEFSRRIRALEKEIRKLQESLDGKKTK